jgi:hypothetical protein
MPNLHSIAQEFQQTAKTTIVFDFAMEIQAYFFNCQYKSSLHHFFTLSIKATETNWGSNEAI